MDQYIQSLTFEYHKQDITIHNSLQLSSLHEYQFGIVKIQMTKNDVKQKNSHIHFVFSVDCSGSMTDMCNDNRNKMQHIKYTLENMIRVFSEKTNYTISVHINTFETDIHNVIANTVVNKDTICSIIDEIQNIFPREMTNIEIALETAKQDISTYQLENKDLHTTIVHILLTDGSPTVGSTDSAFLKTMVSSDYPNIFIGYGKNHDAHFMSELASNPKDVYLFVDELEKAGLVYGEIIHNMLYKLIENTAISTKECEIYNYKTNTWETTLYVGELVSEMEKTFHIRSKTPIESSVYINGSVELNNKEQIVLLPTSFEQNLIKYIFRQKTQELLYETKLFSIRSSKTSSKNTRLFHQRNHFWDREEQKISKKETISKESDIKTKLYFHFQVMMEYAKEHHLENDKFIKMLCDDMIINYEMIGKEELGLYSCARQTSQGRQTSYTPSGNVKTPTYTVSVEVEDSPYSNKGIVETMNIISCDIFNNNNT